MAQTNNKTIAMSAEVLDKLPKGTLNELVGAMQEQIGSVKLDKEAREELKEKLGVDDKVAKEKYICLSSEKGKAVWIKFNTAGRIALLAAFIFFAWEFAMLGWGLCAHGQTRGMRQNGLTLYNAKDIWVELNGFQVFVSVLVTLMTYAIAWIFVLALKRSPSELISFTRCSAAG